jgi:Ca2+-binding RTX toxin-like protein
MNRKLFTRPLRRKALALTALAGSILAGSLAYGPDEATAATKATVKAGTLKISGDAASNNVVLRLQAGSPTTLQIDVGADGTADFSFDRSRFAAIDVQAGAGSDVVRIDQSAGAFPDETITMNGGDGADTLRGGSGSETLLGGRGDDVVAGGDGNDRAELGGGDDTFIWNPGDDNDTVEGQAGGDDRLDFNGSSIGELIDISADNGRVRFTRNIANIAMDLDGVEWLAFHAFGGPDTIAVNDLGGTGVTTADIDLNAAGCGGGDGQPDTVIARGTDGADQVSLTSPGGYATVSGLSA